MPSIESIHNWGKTTAKQLDEVVPANRKFQGSIDPTAVLPNKGFARAYLNRNAGKVESTSSSGTTRTVVTADTAPNQRTDEDPILSIPYEGQQIFVARWFGWEKDPNTPSILFNPSSDVADGTKDTEPALIVVTNIDPDNANNNDWEVLRLEQSAAKYKAAFKPDGPDMVPITNQNGKISLDVIPSLPGGAIYQVSDSTLAVFGDWLAEGASMHTYIDDISSNGDLAEGDEVVFLPGGTEPAEQWLLKDASNVQNSNNWIKTGTATGGGGGDVDAATESALGTILLSTQDQVNGGSGFDDQDRPLVVMPDQLDPWMDDLLSTLSDLSSVTGVNPSVSSTVEDYHSTKLLGYDPDSSKKGVVPVKEVSRRLHSDLTVNGVSVGGLDNNETLDKGESFEDILRKMLQQLNHPSYQEGGMSVEPSVATIDGFSTRPGFTKRRGNTLYVELQRKFLPEITWNTNRNDFGPVQEVRLLQNGSTMDSSTSANGSFTESNRAYGPGSGTDYAVAVEFDNTQDGQLESNNLQNGGSNSVGGFWEVTVQDGGQFKYRDAKNSFYSAENTKYSSGQLVNILTKDKTVRFTGRAPMYWARKDKQNVIEPLDQPNLIGRYGTYADLAEDTLWETSADTLTYGSGGSQTFSADGYMQFLFAVPTTRLNDPRLYYQPKVGAPFSRIDPVNSFNGKDLSPGNSQGSINYAFMTYAADTGSNFSGGRFKLEY